MSKERIIKEACWFTSNTGTVGIVKVIDAHEGVCYFISSVDGINEKQNKEFIADWGSRFPTEIGDRLFTYGWE